MKTRLAGHNTHETGAEAIWPCPWVRARLCLGCFGMLSGELCRQDSGEQVTELFQGRLKNCN